MRLPEIGLGTANVLGVGLPEFIDLAERHGFRRISARPYAFAACLRQGLGEDDLRRRLDQAGIEVTMIDALTDGVPGIPSADEIDPATRAALPPDMLEPPDAETCLRTAEVLGADVLNVTAYLGRPVPLGTMAAAVGGICRRAAPRGVRVALEFVPDSGLPDLAYAQNVVEACGEPNCGITLDVFHLDRSGGSAEDVRRLPPDAIAGIQISDRIRSGAGGTHLPLQGRRLPGEGDLPLAELVGAALENSPRSTIDIEVLSAELRSLSPDEVVARLAGAVKSWVATL